MQTTAISCACRLGPPFDGPLPRLIVTLALAIAAAATGGPALAQPATQPAPQPSSPPPTTAQPAPQPPPPYPAKHKRMGVVKRATLLCHGWVQAWTDAR